MDGKTSSPTLADRYRACLDSLPPPGGNGCHPALLGAADLGIMAGLSPDEVFKDLRSAVPPGKRRVADREIADAVNKAVKDHTAGQRVCAPMPKHIVSNGAVVLRRLIEQGRGTTEENIRAASPVPIDCTLPEEHATLVLKALYDKDNFLFCGERFADGVIGKTIRKAREWLQYFRRGEKPGPHIIVNPLSGKPAPKKSGDGETLRGDFNVSDFRFCVAEFDNLTREDQIAFWAIVNLPIVALIDSGGKSIHAWIDVRKLAGVRTPKDWDHHIKDRLYSQILVPLGVDSACSNAARLSRLPGHFRADKGRLQRLLYLAPNGRRVF